jgi:predicted phage terminase large subunit-like protein
MLQVLSELELRDSARTHLAKYAVFMDIGTPALHHTLICDAIDELLADNYDELIILAPPGSAKSTYTSIALPSYFMGRFPKGHILTASYSTELAEKWGRRVRNIVDSPRFKALFNVSLSKDATAAARWATANGGEFYGAGVGSGILGFRADLAVIDDPISGFEQAQSMTQLSKVHGWYETDFITRLKPQAKVVLICQRLARNDLAGYLIDRNAASPTRRQRILTLPMLAKENDPLGRAPGERLWPEWYTHEMVIDAQRDDYKWRTLYQQEPPADEGSWVSPDDIQFRPSPLNPEVTYACSDLALSVNTGDYTVHFVVAIDKVGDWDILEASRSRVDPEVSATNIVRIAQAHKPKEWLIDDDNASKVFGALVATKAREMGVFVPWKPMPMRGQDKETRAAPLRGMYKRRKVYMPHDAPFTQWFTKELLMFPNALGDGVDDGIDALGLLGRRLLALTHATVPTQARTLPTIADMTLNDLFDDMPKRDTMRI